MEGRNVADIITGILLGMTLGAWIGDLAWKHKLLDKIRYGLRLELKGKLYDITLSDSAGAEPK